MSHETAGKTDEWYTPKYIFDALGDPFFELDVASPKQKIKTHVRCAYYIHENSLDVVWHGFVWMNPPYGNEKVKEAWIKKFVNHGDGIALMPDRTSSKWWQNFAGKADAILFTRKKIQFINENGEIGMQPSNGSTLFAIGERGVNALKTAEKNGLGKLFLNNAGD